MAIELGKEVGAKSVLSAIVQSTFQKALEWERCSRKDFRRVFDSLRRMTGLL